MDKVAKNIINEFSLKRVIFVKIKAERIRVKTT